MKRLNGRLLLSQQERAFKALEVGEWWNGREWRPRGEGPRDATEGAAYRCALDRLAEITDEILSVELGSDEDARVRAAMRFAKSITGDRDESSASTLAEIGADQIFAVARQYLHKKPDRIVGGFTDEPTRRPAWTALAIYVSKRLGVKVTANRLRMICRHRNEG